MLTADCHLLLAMKLHDAVKRAKAFKLCCSHYNKAMNTIDDFVNTVIQDK